MRHPLRVSLHDEYDVDASLLDYLEKLPRGHGPQFLQKLIRVGFRVVVESALPHDAIQEAALPPLKEGMALVAKKPIPQPVPTIKKPAPILGSFVVDDGQLLDADPLFDAQQELAQASELLSPVEESVSAKKQTYMDPLSRLKTSTAKASRKA